MKIDICLMSCDSNVKYYSFFPYVKKIWEKMLNIKCILIYVGEIIPFELMEFSEDIILYKNKYNLHPAFVAQNIRLLWPGLLECDNGILIADIDIIPLSKKYFLDQIEKIDDDSFINYTYEPFCDNICEYYMCYNVAKSNTWRKIFNINTRDDIDELLKKWYDSINYHYDDKYRSKCIGFHNDQKMLYKYIKDSKDLINVVLLDRDVKRYDPDGKIIKDKKKLLDEINKEKWNDFHIPKKFNKTDLAFLI